MTFSAFTAVVYVFNFTTVADFYSTSTVTNIYYFTDFVTVDTVATSTAEVTASVTASVAGDNPIVFAVVAFTVAASITDFLSISTCTGFVYVIYGADFTDIIMLLMLMWFLR